MLGNILGGISKTAFVRPAHNTMPVLDMRNGTWVKGKNGEMLLNGGAHKFTGIVGFPNTFKSTVDNFFLLNDYLRYQTYVLKYDSEGHANYQRINDNLKFLTKGQITDISTADNITLTSVEQYMGDKFFSELKGILKEIAKSKKYVTTPFVDGSGSPIKVLYPITSSIDSITAFDTEAISKMKNSDIGSSERNPESMKGSLFKDQMICELPHVLGVSGSRMTMTGHVGKEFDMGKQPHQKDEKKISHIKDGYKVKKCPDSFLTLTNDTYFLLRATQYRNPNTKEPELPSKEFSYRDRDCELSRISVVPLRGKNGPSGDPFTILSSQYHGILPNCTNFYLIRDEHNYFGLDGGNRSFNTYFLPEEKMSRTTARDKMDENPLLARAVEITAELKLCEYNQGIPRDLLCSPEELYESLKKKFNWNELLQTRRYWLYEHLEKDALPYLSIYDLLLMRKGVVPYWMK